MIRYVAIAATDTASMPAMMYVNHRRRAAPSLYCAGSSSTSMIRSCTVSVIGGAGYCGLIPYSAFGVIAGCCTYGCGYPCGYCGGTPCMCRYGWRCGGTPGTVGAMAVPVSPPYIGGMGAATY